MPRTISPWEAASRKAIPKNQNTATSYNTCGISYLENPVAKNLQPDIKMTAAKNAGPIKENEAMQVPMTNHNPEMQASIVQTIVLLEEQEA
jgi:hypothetical protein